MNETPWTYTVGQRPDRVVAEERIKRRGVVYLRWWGGTNWVRESTGLTLRNTSGALVKTKCQAAEAAAKAKYKTLLAPPEQPAAACEPRPLTILDGLALAIDPARGLYPVETPHRREVVRELERAAAILGVETTWEALTPGSLRELYRVRAAGLRARKYAGQRGAEITVARLLAVAGFLRAERRISDNACRPPRKWRESLAQERTADGKREAGKAIEPHRPRHTIEEMQSILRVAPQVDPRLALAYRIGIGLRLGQVVRVRRSALDLAGGCITVPGRGRKKGSVVILLPEDLAILHDVLTTGYLAPLEALYVQGGGGDYPLFPSGQLTGGRTGADHAVARPEQAHAVPVCMSAIRGWFAAAETLADVRHVKGRSTYGIKRQAVDAAKILKLSRDALTELGGWSDPQMADRIYADMLAREAATEAAHARHSIRGEE